jgi:hypothetical protein
VVGCNRPVRLDGGGGDDEGSCAERPGAGEEGRRGVAGHDDDDLGLPVERHEHAHGRGLLVAAAPRGGLAAGADEDEQRHGDEAHHEGEPEEEVRRRRVPQARPPAAAVPLQTHASLSQSVSASLCCALRHCEGAGPLLRWRRPDGDGGGYI